MAVLLAVAAVLFLVKGSTAEQPRERPGVFVGEAQILVWGTPPSPEGGKGSNGFTQEETASALLGSARDGGADRHSRHLASRGGGSAGAGWVTEMEVVATGYSASREEGTEKGITAVGTKARRGVAAVDPQVISLGEAYGNCTGSKRFG